MSVITINLYVAANLYPFTDAPDANDMLSDAVHEVVDASLVYTQDIFDTWEAYGCPEVSEFEMPETISEAITLATYEALTSEDYSDQLLEGQMEYADTLANRLMLVTGTTVWNSVADIPIAEAMTSLEAIATGGVDMEEAHETLLELRDIIAQVA